MRKRLRCRGCSVLFWLLVSLSGFLAYSYIFPLDIDVRSGSFHLQRMCPACFGENLCPELHAGRITLTNWTRRTVSKVFNAKNVFLAELRLQGSVQQSRLSSQFAFQRCHLPQLLSVKKNVPFHLNSHFNLQF